MGFTAWPAVVSLFWHLTCVMPHVQRAVVTRWLEAPGVTAPGHLTWISCEALYVHIQAPVSTSSGVSIHVPEFLADRGQPKRYASRETEQLMSEH
jgi:hypothetical protein